jgi:hypothetical protein
LSGFLIYCWVSRWAALGMVSVDELVRLEMPGGVMYVEARRLDREPDEGEEEIASVRPKLDQVLETLSGFSSQIQESLRRSGAPRIVLELSVEIAVESGQLIAVLGKASSKSTLKVTLDWVQPRP